MRKRASIAALVLAAVLASMSCSFFTGVVQQVGQTPSALPAVPHATGTGTAPSPSPLPAQPTAVPSTGLESLGRYTITFELSAAGKNDKGEDQTGKLAIVQDVDHSGMAQHLNFHSSGIAVQNQGSKFDLYQQQDQVYLVVPPDEPNPGCTGFSGGSVDLSAFAQVTPETLVGNLEKSRLVRKGEPLDGQLTDHYQFDAATLGGSFQNANGDFWIAQPGGYILRLTGQASGKNVVFNTSLDGQITWNYQVNKAAEPGPIQLPPECASQKPASDLPVPANAQGKGSFAGMLTFKSPDTPELVAEFYRQKLPALGWTAAGETKGDNLIQLEFSRAGKNLKVVIIREGSTGASVTLTESPS